MKYNDLPHYLTIYDIVVFYCPILNELFTYSVGFWKDNVILLERSGLICLGEL